MEGTAAAASNDPLASPGIVPTEAVATTEQTSASSPAEKPWREIVDPEELASVVESNPVLLQIQQETSGDTADEPTAALEAALAAATTATTTTNNNNGEESLLLYLASFPPNTFALPTSFATMIPALQDNSHWLNQRIQNLKQQRWQTRGGDYGGLTDAQVTALQDKNRAFWELYIQNNSSDSTQVAANETHAFREVFDPAELELIVQQNPVLSDIREHGANAKREAVYPADSTAEYVYIFLQNFPQGAFALPQTFRKVVRGLHAGHWLSKKIEEIKNRRWRKSNQAFGTLRPEEVAKLQRCNAAFWHLYIEKKPPAEILRKRQDQYNKKTAHNRTARGSIASAAAPAVDTGPPRSVDGATHTDQTTETLVQEDTDGDSNHEAFAGNSIYTEIDDPLALERLEEIVKMNPVLLKIRAHGPNAKREDVFPTSSTLESEEYVFTFLRHFPENTFALPQIFRKCVKSLNSSHWLAKKVEELKNRRWRIVPGSEYGRLSSAEVAKIKSVNRAFWECYVQKKPSHEEIMKKQALYEKKTANVKQARATRPSSGQAAAPKSETSPKSPTKHSKKTRLVTRASTHSAASHDPATADTFTELQDPTATDILEAVVANNPVLSRIRQFGPAKREVVYPTSTALEADEYVFAYLKHFPENTYALPQTFRKIVKGLNASHWLAKKVMEMKDRRWRLREGRECEYGRMSQEEVDKIKACNLAFWECYINQRPPDDVLSKKRKQYQRKTQHNKTSRSLKKPKLEEIARKYTEEAIQQAETHDDAGADSNPTTEDVLGSPALAEMEVTHDSSPPMPPAATEDVVFL